MSDVEKSPGPGKAHCRLIVRETPEQGIAVAIASIGSLETGDHKRVVIPPERATAACLDEAQVRKMAREVLAELPPTDLPPVGLPEWMVETSSRGNTARLAALLGTLMVLGGDQLRAEVRAITESKGASPGPKWAGTDGDWWGPRGTIAKSRGHTGGGQ